MFHSLQVLDGINTVTHLKEGTYIFVFRFLLEVMLQVAVNRHHYKCSSTHSYPLTMLTQMRAHRKT